MYSKTGVQAYEIVVETKDGKSRKLLVRWTDTLEEQFSAMFGMDVNLELMRMTFQEIIKSLQAENINISDIKYIRFEESGGAI